MNIKGRFSKDELVLLSSIDTRCGGKEAGCRRNIKDVSRLLKIAELNGVEVSFSRFLKDKLKLSIPLLEESISTFEKLKKTREELALNVQSIAREHDCQILFIKSFMDFPYIDDDVDTVLISNPESLSFEEIITSCGFQCHRSRSQWREPNKRQYYSGSTLPIKNKRVCLHLHFLISWNSMTFLDSSRVWERKREYSVREDKLAIPSIEDEILIIAAHTVFENKHIKLWELIQFLHLLKSGKVDWDYIVESSKMYNWSSGLWLFLQSMRAFAESVGVACHIPEKTFSVLTNEYKFLRKVDKILTYRRCLPFMIPFLPTLIIFFHKFVLDFKLKNFRSMMRELNAFTLFDWVLYYRLRKKLWRLKKREENL